MAIDVEDFEIDTQARGQGAWIEPDPISFPGVRIKTRGLTRRYFQELQRRERQEKRDRNFPQSADLPNEVQASVNLECLIDEALIDVEGMTRKGVALDFRAFCELIRDDKYEMFRRLAYTAAGAVSEIRKGDVAEAGNSSGSGSHTTSSTGTSSGP